MDSKSFAGAKVLNAVEKLSSIFDISSNVSQYFTASFANLLQLSLKTSISYSNETTCMHKIFKINTI